MLLYERWPMRVSVKQITMIGIFAALSLIIFMVEAELPVFEGGGIKLGLANIVTLCSMKLLGRKEAGAVLAVRVLLASVFCGSAISLIFSASGAFLAYTVMCLLIGRLDDRQLWVVSVLGAIGHNLGQTFAAYFVCGSAIAFSMLPYLLISAVITGALVGIVSMKLVSSPLRRFSMAKK